MQTISPFGALTANTIPPADFEKLTLIPIVVCYGGYIPDKPSDNGGQWTAGGAGSKWRALFAPCINRHGGDATVVHLPELGIRGNSHSLFAEKNNVRLADLLSAWLAERGLDRSRSATLAHLCRHL